MELALIKPTNVTDPVRRQQDKKQRKGKKKSGKNDQRVLQKGEVVQSGRLGDRIRPDRITTPRAQLAPVPRSTAPAIRIAKSISLPLESPPVRWSNEYSDVETCIANPKTYFDVPSYVGTQPSGWISNVPSNINLAMVFRDPYRAAIYLDPNYSNQPFQYALRSRLKPDTGFYVGPALAQTSTGTEQVNLDIVCAEVRKTSYATNKPLTYAPHGTYLFPGNYNGKNYLWMDRGICQFQFNPFFTDVNGVSMNPYAGTNIVLTAYKFVGGTSAVVSSYRSDVTQGWYLNFQIPEPAYYAFDYQWVWNAIVMPNVVPSGSTAFRVSTPIYANFGNTDANDNVIPGAIWAHRCLPDFVSQLGNIDSIRILSAALRFSNYASELNKQGTVISCQSPVGSYWTDFNKPDVWSMINDCHGSVVGPAENGQYIWMKPSQTSDFDYKTVSPAFNPVPFSAMGQPIGGFNGSFDLVSKSGFLITATRIVGATGMDGQYAIAWGVEYLSESQWVDSESSTNTAADYANALEILKFAPHITENPLHLRSIWNSIKEGVKALPGYIVKYGPSVIKLAQTVAKMV